MKKPWLLLAAALLPFGAMAAAAPGPDWAFLTPDPNAPAGPVDPAGVVGLTDSRRSATEPGVPNIVVAGKGTDVRACNTCHTVTGMGQPQSANLRGLNAAYFARQMMDFRSGARGGVRVRAMSNFAKGMTDDEIKNVAAYYARLRPIQWTRIIESEVAPKSIVSRNNRRVRLPGSDTEAVGSRIIEIGTNRTAIRQTVDPAFVAFVPPGMINAGKELALSGGGGKTQACAMCHGEKLLGKDDVPIIAGRSPVYIARQIYAFRSDLRKGPMAGVMKDVVAKLSDDDVIAMSSYVASLNPF